MGSSLSLMERFVYGNNPRSLVEDRVGSELLEEAPRRHRSLISLAEKQIEAQERAASAIAASNIMGAEIVALEIEQQSIQMRQSFEQVGEILSQDILSLGDQVSSAIEKVGSRLTMELAEISWQMAQQNRTLERILHVLQESRSNEARQLVSQGVRHYLNQQYERAEERFLRALDFDTTDYQVLMNLAYIEMYKDNADRAHSYFRDALSLPKVQDDASRARALWAIARLHYAHTEYQQALMYARESLKYDAHNSRHRLVCGAYAALSGRQEEAMNMIDDAIEMDPSLFAIAAVEPDLEIIRDRVVELLSNVSQAAFLKAVRQDEHVRLMLQQLDRNEHNANYQPFIARLRTMYSEIHEGLQKPSYTGCLQAIDHLLKLEGMLVKGIAIILEIDQAAWKIRQLQIERADKESDYEKQDCLYQNMEAHYHDTYGKDERPKCFTVENRYFPSLTLAYMAVTGIPTLAVGFAHHIVIAVLMGVVFMFTYFFLIGCDVLKPLAESAKRKVGDQALIRFKAEEAMNACRFRVNQAEKELACLISSLEQI